MGWYRSSSRFIFDVFRRYNSRDCRRQKSHSGISSSKPNFTGKFSQPIFRNTTALQGGLKQSQWGRSVLIGAKRYYCVDRNRVHHFKRAEILIKLVMVVVVSSGAVIKLYFCHLETVPCTKRAHYVPLLISREKEIGDYHFKLLKSQFKGKILPPLHPQSIRVLRISQDIIGALHKGLMKKKDQQVWRISYSSESVMLHHETMTHSMGDQWKLGGEDKWHKDEEILDDKWVQQSRKRGEDKGKKSHTAHLEGLNWEVIVVDLPVINAICLLGGKIIIFTGMLQHCTSDAELAAIIGHEIAHVVARHNVEQGSTNIWFHSLELILYLFFMPDLVNTKLRLPLWHRMEMEADCIGVLLMALAGYDPRVAPQVLEELGRIDDDSSQQDYLASHPSGKKRAKVLAEAKVMEEAMSIYWEVQAGHVVEAGFL